VTRLPRTIVIVGAGFSGTTVAINLLRLSYWKPVRVVLVDRAERMARGVAYAQTAYPYLLNVPAGRMSLNSSDPLEFLKFARKTHPSVTEDDFLPRSLYGEYLESALHDAELSSPSHVRLHRIRGDVCAIGRTTNTSTFRVELTDGSSFIADDLVLASGNPLPASISAMRALQGSSRYLADPWSSRPEFHLGETVLVIGTGLTMADMVTAGSEAAHNVTFHAISRHGLVPPSQTAFRHAGCNADEPSLVRAAALSARHLLHAVRELSEEVQRRGGDWREAITCVRNLAPILWQRLPNRERERFLRHARPYWEVHRHRLPQETLAKLNRLRRSGNLHIHAGRILTCEPVGGKIRVSWKARGGDAEQTLLVDHVINCTGADYNPERSREPLMRSLLKQDLATPDALGLGLRTGAHGALINSRGQVEASLYYIGPMLRADHWECTAAQELRIHAERLAHHLAAPAVKPMFAVSGARPPGPAPAMDGRLGRGALRSKDGTTGRQGA
jgi:uncharacterized NAD(P)/FAD-binding protein YdhS